MTIVAKELGVTRQTVARHARMRGIRLTRRLPGPRSLLPSVAEIVERINDGESATAIARAAGVTRPAVVTRLARAGYSLKGGVVTKIGEAS